MFTLRNPRLQYLFNSEIDELKKSFLDLQKQTDEKNYKYEVMIAFWLAIELQKDEEARTMVSIDPLVSQIIINLRENGTVYQKHQRKLMLKREKNNLNYVAVASQQQDNDDESRPNPLDSKSKVEKLDKPKEYAGIEMDERNEVSELTTQKFKQFQGKIAEKEGDKLPHSGTIEELDEGLERLKQVKRSGEIRDMQDVLDLKKIMKSKVGSPFATNVLRIALNFKEEVISSVLVYAYMVSLDEKMLVRALKTN